MVSPYPHTLVATIQNSNSVQDNNGNWERFDDDTTLQIPCRAEPNGNSYITLSDGSKYSFAFIVYMPFSNPDIPVGATVQINDDVSNNMVAKGNVKQFYRGQLNCRLWL